MMIRSPAFAASLLLLSLTHAQAQQSCASEGEFGYSGGTGPSCWGQIEPQENRACATGNTQSPVDLKAQLQRDTSFSSNRTYKPVPLNVQNTGHSIQVNIDSGEWFPWIGARRPDGGRISWGLPLKQVHFHAPAEHKINGKTFDLEAHLVHADPQDRTKIRAVKGILFQTGAENRFLSALLSKPLPGPGLSVAYSDVTVNPDDLISPNSTVWTYSGSLTTPPCTEGIYWEIHNNPLTASQTQISTLATALGFSNNRPPQTLKGHRIRHVY